MKISNRLANCILLIIPLAIYGTELLFWFTMMNQNKFPSEYNIWRGAILFTIVVMIVFAVYVNITSDRLTVRLMTMLTPAISYIIGAIYALLVIFIMWDTAPLIGKTFDLFCFCFTCSYLIPFVLLLIRVLGPIIADLG